MADLRLPAYRLHKARGLAVVTLSGQDVYLGKHGSPESKAAYERRIAEWLTRGRTVQPTASAGSSVNEVMLAYLQFAETYYRDAEGQLTREIETMTLAFRPLKALYGYTLACEFGPLALETVRDRLIAGQLARRVVNQRIGYIKRMFRWASSKQIIPASVYHGLLSLVGLRRGRSAAKETDPIQPVPDPHVDAILPFLPPTLRAMVELHRLTGMRSGELCRMRLCEIDIVDDKKWTYSPSKHKGAYLGRKRIIPLGPRCQALLNPLLGMDVTAFLFSPRCAEQERDQIMRSARKSTVQPSQLCRKKRKPKREPGECYNTRSYYAALRYAMRAAQKADKLAMEEFWHPHQLRHSAALRIQREQGLEAARAYLGHAKADMTAHYAGVDTALAISVAERFG